MKVAKIIMLLALAAALGAGARLAWLAGTVARELPLRADLAIAREAAATRALLGQQTVAALLSARVEIEATRRALEGQFQAARREAMGEVRGIRMDALKVLDARLGQALQVADRQLGQANGTIAAEAAKLNTSVALVAAVAPPIQATAQQVADAAPLWMDCDHNADCLFNRWVGTSRGVEKMAQALGANAAPQQAALTGIAEDVHKVTTEFTRPRRWWEKLWSGIKASAGVAVLAAK